MRLFSRTSARSGTTSQATSRTALSPTSSMHAAGDAVDIGVGEPPAAGGGRCRCAAGRLRCRTSAARSRRGRGAGRASGRREASVSLRLRRLRCDRGAAAGARRGSAERAPGSPTGRRRAAPRAPPAAPAGRRCRRRRQRLRGEQPAASAGRTRSPPEAPESIATAPKRARARGASAPASRTASSGGHRRRSASLRRRRNPRRCRRAAAREPPDRAPCERLQTSNPPAPGMCTSAITTSGFDSLSCAIASAPFETAETRKSSSMKVSSTTFWMVTLSSASRIVFVIAPPSRSPGCRIPAPADPLLRPERGAVRDTSRYRRCWCRGGRSGRFRPASASRRRDRE